MLCVTLPISIIFVSNWLLIYSFAVCAITNGEFCSFISCGLCFMFWMWVNNGFWIFLLLSYIIQYLIDLRIIWLTRKSLSDNHILIKQTRNILYLFYCNMEYSDTLVYWWKNCTMDLHCYCYQLLNLYNWSIELNLLFYIEYFSDYNFRFANTKWKTTKRNRNKTIRF